LQSPTGGIFGPEAQLNKWENKEKKEKEEGKKFRKKEKGHWLGFGPTSWKKKTKA
jgi:hypothetical protein